MKKLLFFLLILSILFSMSCVIAKDEVTELEGGSYSFNSVTGTLAYKPVDSSYYTIIDSYGNALTSSVYTNAYANDMGFYTVEVSSADKLHNEGMLDGYGNVLVPPEYYDAKYISDRWQLGIKLTFCDADDKDYTVNENDGKSYYRIKSVDFYFDGKLVGSLARSDYQGSCTAYGAFIRVKNRAGDYVYYDSQMRPSAYHPVNFYSGEYDVVRENGQYVYYHMGTGERVFVPECTLSANDVADAFLYLEDEGMVIDLQGNEVFRMDQKYSNLKQYSNGYYRIGLGYLSNKPKYGIMDSNARVIIPPEYDRIGYTENPFKFGYVSMMKDGQFGFLNLQGKITFTYPILSSESAVRDYGSLAEISAKETMPGFNGGYIVLSAAVGVLPGIFEYVDVPSFDNSAVFIAGKVNGEKCLFDYYGNELIPFSADYDNIEATPDGAVAVVSYQPGTADYGVIRIFHFDPVTAGNEGKNGPDEPADAGDTWTCENGHSGNTGKFCMECGAPKPVADDGTWTCENGHSGNTGNFCSECGVPKPVDDGTWTCVNGHSGNTGNFCSECGAPRN